MAIRTRLMLTGASVPLIEADLRKVAPEDLAWAVVRGGREYGAAGGGFALAPRLLPKRVFNASLDPNE